MFHHSRELISGEEKERLRRATPKPLFGRLLSKDREEFAEEPGILDIYRVSVESCFVPADFNEELPLYVLDIGGMILVLFGQWMFDPHMLTVRENIFEMWDCGTAFFEAFSLRCLDTSGKVLRLGVEGSSFVRAQMLPPTVRFKALRECQLVAGGTATLVDDLLKAGLIETK